MVIWYYNKFYLHTLHILIFAFGFSSITFKATKTSWKKKTNDRETFLDKGLGRVLESCV